MRKENNKKIVEEKLHVQYVPTASLKTADYNPRKWSKGAEDQLKESIKKFGLVDPFILNAAPKRKNVLIGGHFSSSLAQKR